MKNEPKQRKLCAFRLSPRTSQKIKDLAEQTGITQAQVVTRAIDGIDRGILGIETEGSVSPSSLLTARAIREHAPAVASLRANRVANGPILRPSER